MLFYERKRFIILWYKIHLIIKIIPRYALSAAHCMHLDISVFAPALTRARAPSAQYIITKHI